MPDAQCPLRSSTAPSLMRAGMWSAVIGCAALLTNLTGCGPKSDLMQVSGEVILNGAPVPNGSIRLSSVGSEKAFSTGAMIRDGKYLIPQDKGLPPGTYQIVISAGDPNAPQVRDRPGGAVAPELIPAKYNVDSQETVEVKADGENHFVFDIKS